VRVTPSAVIVIVLSFGCQKAPAQSSTQAAAAQPRTQSSDATPGAARPTAAQATQPGTEPQTPDPAATPKAAEPAAKPVPAALPDVLARVNGEDIKRAEFERALKNMESRAGRQVPAEQRDRVFRGLLDQLVTLHVLLQESRSRNITVTDADLDARLQEVKKQFPNEQEFTKALASRNMTVEGLREEARSEIAVSKMVQAEVAPQIKIQESDVKAFYDKNPQQFQQPETFRASHILIRVDANATEAQKKEARTKIEGLLEQIRQGADFAAIATTNSQDGSASNAGDLNFFRKGQMVAPFQQAVEALEVGKVSGVVETQFGYHLIKLTDKRPARTVPLSEVSTRIGQFLMMREKQQKAGKFVETLKAKSKIEILI
jgi:peptidyl-prolyl cis-trans isomerase C